MTSVLGKIYDGPTPIAVNWTTSEQSGDCKLLEPDVPFCDPACGSDVCVADGVCQAYPTAKTAGTVAVVGLRNSAGASELVLIEVAKAYQLPGDAALSYPPFAEGDSVRVITTGGDYAPFGMEARGINELELTNGSVVIESGKPVTLTWKPAASSATSVIHVKLDISHHGGTKGLIECATADTGSLELPASLIARLLSLGVAGFPTIVVARRSIGLGWIASGRVELIVTSDVERAVTIPGLHSCSANADCPAGQTCLADLTCR